MKKTIIIVASILTALVLLISSIFIYKNICVQNVFDEMYYSESRAILKPTNTSFYNVNVIQNQPHSSTYHMQDISMFVIDSSFLLEDEGFVISIAREEGQIYLSYRIVTSNGTFHFEVLYDVHANELTLFTLSLRDYMSSNGEYYLNSSEQIVFDDFFNSNPFTQAQIVSRVESVLFDIFIPSWVAGNSGRTRFSGDSIGDIEINL